MDLNKKKCIPCEKKTKPLEREEFSSLLEEVPSWKVLADKKIEREFIFKDFSEALAFLNEVGDIAEMEGHHPDMNLHNWNKITITLSTHSIGGLSDNDFILAAKIDAQFNLHQKFFA